MTMLSAKAQRHSVEMAFICACGTRFDTKVFRNKLCFTKRSEPVKPVVDVEWVGEEGMEVKVVCPSCHQGCLFKGDAGLGTFTSVI